MISDRTIEEVKARANLVELVSETVALKRTGVNYSGLCPFHSERSPSFHVKADDNFYHCFGCGASGNSISYVMQTKGLSFPEAVEELAIRFNIEIQRVGVKSTKREDKKIYFDLNMLSFNFYREALKKAEPAVKEYLKRRGLNAQSVNDFGLGLAPKGWHGLVDFLKSKKISEEVLLKSGLVRRSPKGDLYDTFRGRLLFPIWVDTRKIVGFGGRIIDPLFSEDELVGQPKYLNSPETPIYHKSKVLYGLPQAIAALRHEREVLLVEGYMDVVGLARVGVKNVVATCGTAVTDQHIKRLAYLVKRVTVVFDGDDAGRRAAAKSYQVFLNSGIDASVLFLPDGSDPDDIAREKKEGAVEFLRDLSRFPLFDAYLEEVIAREQVAGELGSVGKGKIGSEVARIISQVKNPIERAEMEKKVAFRLQVDHGVLGRLLDTKTSLAADIPTNEVTLASDSHEIHKLPVIDREVLLCVMAKKGKLIERVLSSPELGAALMPITLSFIEGLRAVMDTVGEQTSEDDKKDRVRELLRGFGASWLAHWKKAHDMDRLADVDLNRSFEECVARVKKNKLNQIVMSVDRQLSSSTDPLEREQLLSEKVSLFKMLRSGQ